MADLPDLERLPTYSSIDPLHPTINTNHDRDLTVTFSNLSPTASHTYEIHTNRTTGGLDITYGAYQLYHVGRYLQHQTPDIVVYGGYDTHGPQLALARFIQDGKNFNIHLGGLKRPVGEDWDIVRCASDGRMFHSTPYYRFEVPATDARSGERSKRKLHWKRTHESKLGASHLSRRDYKLVDESSDEVVAVYTEHSISFEGKVSYRRKMDDYVEVASLVVLMAILERQRRAFGNMTQVIAGHM